MLPASSNSPSKVTSKLQPTIKPKGEMLAHLPFRLPGPPPNLVKPPPLWKTSKPSMNTREFTIRRPAFHSLSDRYN
jgi:hypothetical protein